VIAGLVVLLIRFERSSTLNFALTPISPSRMSSIWKILLEGSFSGKVGVRMA
jgi:hypothetical protein